MSSVNSSSLFPNRILFMGLIRALDQQKTFQLLHYTDHDDTRTAISKELIEAHLRQAEKRSPGSREKESQKLMKNHSQQAWAVLWHVTEQASMKVKAVAISMFFGLRGSPAETLISGTDAQIHRLLRILDEYAGPDLLETMRSTCTQEEICSSFCLGAFAIYRMMEQNGSLNVALKAVDNIPDLPLGHSRELAEHKNREMKSS